MLYILLVERVIKNCSGQFLEKETKFVLVKCSSVCLQQSLLFFYQDISCMNVIENSKINVTVESLNDRGELLIFTFLE